MISGLLCTIALAVFLALNNAYASNPVEYPKTGDVYVSVQGRSMEPTIHDGSLIKCMQENSYNIGDIVAFSNWKYMISHRIIGELSDKFITKGDGNTIPDFGLISKVSILCKLML